MMKSFVSPLISASIGTVLVLLSLHISLAQVMESTNYSIQSDSINFGGGLSTSTNYGLESTAGEVASGNSDSTNYSLRAGYQQMQEVYLAMTSATDVTLSPSIPGVSNGQTAVLVTTDSPSGYSLTIAATTNPAMIKGADSIADYVPAGDPDFTFATGPADAHFAYSPEGSDVVARFKDNGSACGSGSSETELACWDGLSITEEAIATSLSPNHPAGSTTTVRFRVGVGGSVVQPPGIYTATTTLTAIPL